MNQSIGDHRQAATRHGSSDGRIDKTLHSLRFIDDQDMRRGTLTQLNPGEGWYSVARVVFSAN